MTVPEPEKALFEFEGGDFRVHFNPETLQYDLTNRLQADDNENSAVQSIEDSTAKLSLDLVWDTTGTGGDVREQTKQVLVLMKPNEGDSAPQRVTFRWGVFSFGGFIESYKEVIDFFSANGVPLRATTSVVLTEQTVDWAALAGNGGNGGGDDSTAVTPQPGQDAGSATDDGGDNGGNTGRDVAEANELDDIRNPGSQPLVVPGN
ncbi:MAG: hypothetical protein KTR31_04470, partial [Myxococcales bacterium]|nr:hypothetical protein [Myxococcales bacterium]